MNKFASLFVLLGFVTYSFAQTPAPAIPPIATDVTAEEQQSLFDAR